LGFCKKDLRNTCVGPFLLTVFMWTHIMCIEKLQYQHKGKTMKNITIALDESIINAGREYARKHDTSLNGLIRTLLEQRVMPMPKHWLDGCFDLMDRAQGDSRGQTWKRDDLYRG